MIKKFKKRVEELLTEKYDLKWRSINHAEARSFSHKTLKRMISLENGLPQYKTFMEFLVSYGFDGTPEGQELLHLYNAASDERATKPKSVHPDIPLLTQIRDRDSQRTHRAPRYKYRNEDAIPSVEECLKQNELVWSEWTEVNIRSEEYPVAKFMNKEIDSTLMPLETSELGSVEGKKILHLQCHFGLDTISLAKMGAEVIGVDFDNRAIMKARQIADEMGIQNVQFIKSDVRKLRDVLPDTQFDIVFTSYGVLPWLPSVEEWATNAAHFIKPGGVLYIAEFHPFTHVFDNSDDVRGLYAKRSYFNNTARAIRLIPYVEKKAPSSDKLLAYQWHHTLQQVVCSIIDSGLRISYLHEFPYTSWMHFPFVEKDEEGWRRLPYPLPEIPLLFSIMAVKEK